MTTNADDVVNRLSIPVHTELKEAIPPLLVLVCSLLVYAVTRSIFVNIAQTSPQACLILEVMICAGAALLTNIQFSEVPGALRILARGIAFVVLIQIAFDGSMLFYAPEAMVTGVAGTFFRIGTVVGLLSGLLSMRWPAFILPLAFHYIAFRNQFNIMSGISVSETDYRSMLDIVVFLGTGAIISVTTSRAFASMFRRGSADAARIKEVSAHLIWACAVGAHLGNYLISGWTKIRAGGSEPWFWLLHNPTQTSILIGLERGDNPLAMWPPLVQAVWNFISGGGVFLNAVVLGTQLVAPLGILHRRLLMTLVVLYDLFHIGVYLTLGALFHFWIIVNVLVYFSAKRMQNTAFTPMVKVTAICAALAGHFLFYTSHLGWLDGAKLASPSFVAETADGSRVPVPSVFFGLPSYSIAQTATYIPDGHFPMRLGGNTYNVTDWRDSQACGPQMRERQEAGVTPEIIVNAVRGVDAGMRRHPLVKRNNLYYFYPHHMVANPFLFRTFNRLSMADIVRYHYIVDSVCLGLRDGYLERDLRKRTDYVINVHN